MVTFTEHVVNLSFQSVSHMARFFTENESRFGKMKVLHIADTKVIARYSDHYGYISARQSDRWSRKKSKLWKSEFTWHT